MAEYTRSLTNQQLIYKDSHRPPVALTAIVTITTLRLEHLGGDVVRCAYSRVTVHHTCLQTDKYTRYTTQRKQEVRSSSDGERLAECGEKN